jgi:hypothetical protein
MYTQPLDQLKGYAPRAVRNWASEAGVWMWRSLGRKTMVARPPFGNSRE